MSEHKGEGSKNGTGAGKKLIPITISMMVSVVLIIGILAAINQSVKVTNTVTIKKENLKNVAVDVYTAYGRIENDKILVDAPGDGSLIRGLNYGTPVVAVTNNESNGSGTAPTIEFDSTQNLNSYFVYKVVIKNDGHPDDPAKYKVELKNADYPDTAIFTLEPAGAPKRVDAADPATTGATATLTGDVKTTTLGTPVSKDLYIAVALAKNFSKVEGIEPKNVELLITLDSSL